MALTSTDRSLLQKNGITRVYEKGKIIFLGAESISYLFLLQKGIVKITHCNKDDVEMMRYFLKSGALLGELNLLKEPAGEGRYEFAVTMEKCEICMIPVDVVTELMNKHQFFRTNMMHLLGMRFRKTEEQVFAVSFKSVEERVLDFIKNFAIDFGIPTKQGYAARNFLTHEDIAKATYTARQTATTILIKLKRQGLIDYNHCSIQFFERPAAINKSAFAKCSEMVFSCNV